MTSPLDIVSAPVRIVPAAKKRSPSQIAAFMRCNRRWALSRIYGSRSGESAKQGIRLHGHREEWLLKAKLPDDERDRAIVESGIPHLPPPGSVHVELDIQPIDRGFYRLEGRRDFVRPPVDGSVALTGDHKFTSNLGYALNEETLRTDPQGVVYAAAGMIDFGQDEHDLLWVYTCTNQPYKTRPVHLTVIYDDVARELEKIDDVARQMESFAGQPPEAVPVNINACGDYGGCSYAVECGLTTHERLGLIMSAESTLDRLRRQKAEAAAAAGSAPAPAPAQEAPAAAPSQPAATQAPAPAPAQGGSALDRMRALRSTTAPAAPPAQEAPSLASQAAAAQTTPAPASVVPTLTGASTGSRRERYAMAAMTGLLANPACASLSPEKIIAAAIAHADALVKAVGE